MDADKEQAQRKAQSKEWNAFREVDLYEINVHGKVLNNKSSKPDNNGWYLVSRHASSVNSAYQTQRRLRKLWQRLEFKVINTQYDAAKPWIAEIHARRVKKV